jgi:hypothetical protein
MDMKRSLMVLAAVFAVASTSAFAGDLVESKTATPASKAVELTDEQLDEITAAGAVVGVAVSNPGNAMHLRVSDNKVLCINCSEIFETLPSGDGTFVLLEIRNRVHPPTDPIMKCLGRCPSGLGF